MGAVQLGKWSGRVGGTQVAAIDAEEYIVVS